MRANLRNFRYTFNRELKPSPEYYLVTNLALTRKSLEKPLYRLIKTETRPSIAIIK